MRLLAIAVAAEAGFAMLCTGPWEEGRKEGCWSEPRHRGPGREGPGAGASPPSDRSSGGGRWIARGLREGRLRQGSGGTAAGLEGGR